MNRIESKPKNLILNTDIKINPKSDNSSVTPKMSKKVFHKLLNLSIASMIAFIVLYIIGYLFIDTSLYFEYNPQLKKWIPFSGKYMYTKEGYASSYIGKFAISGIPDITKIKNPKILFWGDSYVEGFNVPDKDKMAQQFTHVVRENKNKNFIGVGYGFSGASLSDYILEVKNIETLIKNIKMHVIVIDDLKDFIPSDKFHQENKFSKYVSRPNYQIVSSTWTPPDNDLQKFYNQTGLNAARRILGNLRASLKNARFSLGVVKLKTNLPGEEPVMKQKYSDYILSELRAQTKLPIILIYVPSTPVLNNGKVKYLTGENDITRKVALSCQKNNIHFINVAENFNNFFKERRIFPRGFFNSSPDSGHTNQYGNKLIAEIVYNKIYQMENF